MMEEMEAPAKMVLSSKRKTSLSTTPRFCPGWELLCNHQHVQQHPSNCGSNLGQGTCLCFMYCSTYVSMSGLNGVIRGPRSAMPRDFPVACLSPLVPTFKTPKGVRGGFNPVRTPKTCLGAKCRLERKDDKRQKETEILKPAYSSRNKKPPAG